MKVKTKITLILLLGILMLGIFFCTNQVKATNEKEVIIEILDIDGYGEQVYGWNGKGQLVEKNSETERNFVFTTTNNYGNEFETEIGTFTLKENNDGKYVYTCPFNKEKFTDISGEYKLVFTVNNKDTGNTDTLTSYFFIYDEMAFPDVYDSEGNRIDYNPPQSGGLGTILNQDTDFTNCIYELSLKSDYGEKFETELGTFALKEDKDGSYVYTCPVNADYIKNVDEGAKNYFCDIENKITGKVDKVLLWIWFYRLDLTETSNLSVNGIDMIENGKVIKDMIGLDEGEEGYQIEYQEHTNKIVVKNGDEINLNYSDMGEDFNIEWSNFDETPIKVNIISEDTKTGITMNNTIEGVNGTIYRAPKLNVNTVTSGDTYNRVQTALSNEVNKFVVYDIDLTSENIEIQPNGKVKMIIPIPNDFDTSNLVVYRIEEDGTKTKYDVTVEGEYAVFETDHFSTYVLAEEKEQIQDNTDNESDNTDNTNNNETDSTNKGELDETPKTGVETNGTIALTLVSIVSLAGVIALKKF